LKIALAQINPTIGDLAGNVRKIEAGVQDAQSAGAELVVFSELALSGYPPKDLLHQPDFISENQKCLEDLIARLTGPAVLCGHIRKRPEGEGLFNAATLFQNGKILSVAEKILLPTYDVFDEARYFRAGETLALCDFGGVRLGLTICEDIWNFPGFCDQRGYHRNPVEELVRGGAQMIVNVSASPYRLGRWQTREDLGRHIAQTFGVPLVSVNQVVLAMAVSTVHKSQRLNKLIQSCP